MSQPDAIKSGLQATYEHYLAQGKLMIQRVKSTGEYMFLPGAVTQTGAINVAWIAVGEGVRRMSAQREEVRASGMVGAIADEGRTAFFKKHPPHFQRG